MSLPYLKELFYDFLLLQNAPQFFGREHVWSLVIWRIYLFQLFQHFPYVLLSCIQVLISIVTYSLLVRVMFSCFSLSLWHCFFSWQNVSIIETSLSLPLTD